MLSFLIFEGSSVIAHLSHLFSGLNQSTSFQVFLHIFQPVVCLKSWWRTQGHCPLPKVEHTHHILDLKYNRGLLSGKLVPQSQVFQQKDFIEIIQYCILKPLFSSHSNSIGTFIHLLNKYFSSLWVSDRIILLTLIKKRCITFNPVVGKSLHTQIN